MAAARRIASGEVAVSDRPLVRVPLGRYRLGTHVWNMVERLLVDPERLKQCLALKLHSSRLPFAPELDGPAEDALVKRSRKSRAFVRQLYMTVATNNIAQVAGHHQIIGYALYPTISRADHSCEPNCALAPGEPAAAEGRLVALRDIEAGEPLTWCYFEDERFDRSAFFERNMGLVNMFQFACRCTRCMRERPADLPKGDLTPMFRRLLADEMNRLTSDR